MKLYKYAFWILLIATIIMSYKFNSSLEKNKQLLRHKNEHESCRAHIYRNFNFDRNEYYAKTKLISDIMPLYDELLSKANEQLYLNARKPASKEEKIKFCVVIPSYNNVKYAVQNINSVLMQEYHNWRIIYIDDASTDGMSEEVQQMKLDSKLSDNKFTYVRYEERKRRASYSFYNAAHNYCKDDEVMVMLDGDDMLASPKVLQRLADVYSDGNTWLTYGHLLIMRDGEMCPITREATNAEFQDLRNAGWWGFSHLRTSYTWLFKKIKKEDLMYKDGDFLTSSWDLAIMIPMLEMAGKERSKYISDITYLYRFHPNNDVKLYAKEQKELEKYVLELKPYKRLENAE